MSILGIAAGVGSAIFGAVSAARQARKRNDLLDEQEKRNQELYDRRYNEDVTQRSEAQAYINRMRTALSERSKAARGRQAAGGATTEAVAAEKKAGATAMGDFLGRLASQASARRGNIEDAYLSRKDAIDSARANIAANTAAQTQQAVSNLAGAVSEFEDLKKNK